MKLYIKGENIGKYFEHIGESKDFILVPKTKDFFKYYQYIKNYGVVYNLSYFNDYINLFCCYEDYKKYGIPVLIDFFHKDILEFEFPDDYPEEDLFYFKMKYAGL